jgi:hypothetical protein
MVAGSYTPANPAELIAEEDIPLAKRIRGLMW